MALPCPFLFAILEREFSAQIAAERAAALPMAW
jgi:hypothetical protein